MARPFLADAELVLKAAEDRAEEINTCIGCNQACLDHTFSGKLTTCLVNPRACNETLLTYVKTAQPKSIAVVGAGPAGLSCATVAAERGHDVTLFDQAGEIGGQFNMAKRIPGKEEFVPFVAWFERMVEAAGVTVTLGRRGGAEDLQGFDEVIVATGVGIGPEGAMMSTDTYLLPPIVNFAMAPRAQSAPDHFTCDPGKSG